MLEEISHIKEWEREEIERSATEAEHVSLEALRYSEDHFARYADPPADTCFPLEYSYHLLGDVRGKTIVDLGCGSGENTALLVRRGAKVVGMDISPPMIQVAKQRLVANGGPEQTGFFAASAHAIPLSDGSVDVVFGIAILHHLDLSLVSREVLRILRKGGCAIFQEPVRNSRLLKFARRCIPYKSPDVSPFERPLTYIELKNFADGLAEYYSKDFFLPYVSIAGMLPFPQSLVHPLLSFDRAVLKEFPYLRNYATVRVVRVVK